MCIGCVSLCHLEGALYLRANWKPCGPNSLDELLKDFIVIPTNLPRKGIKRLAESPSLVFG